jgi:hypothetical protein
MMKSEDTPIQDENTPRGSGDTLEPSQVKHDIPKFDLAEQILVAQRKVASFKRTAPSRSRISDRNRKSNIESEIKKQDTPVSNPIPEPNPNPNPIPINDTSQDKIISEIVARDILQFRSGRIAK